MQRRQFLRKAFRLGGAALAMTAAAIPALAGHLHGHAGPASVRGQSRRVARRTSRRTTAVLNN